MKYGLVWERMNALSTSQLTTLKRSAGLKLRDAPPDAVLSFYSILNDEYKYDEETEDELFFTLCVDALFNCTNTTNIRPGGEGGQNLEKCLSYLYSDSTPSTKRDITALCAERRSTCGRLEKHLLRYIRQIKRDDKCKTLNTKKLEWDLTYWNAPDHKVQMDWGKTIARNVKDDSNEGRETNG